MAEKTIKFASFPYAGPGGKEYTAMRGDTVDITTDADLERGERLGVFATKADLASGSPFAAFLASRRERSVPVEEPDEPEPEKPAAPEKPGASASRTAWAAYAVSKGAPDEETAEQGGLTRDQLRDKYGA